MNQTDRPSQPTAAAAATEAIERYRRALTAGGESAPPPHQEPGARYAAGRVLELAARPDDALRAYVGALAANESATLLGPLRGVERTAGDQARATAAELVALGEQSPGRRALIVWAAALLARRGQRDEALALLDRAEALQPSLVESCRGLLPDLPTADGTESRGGQA